MKYLTLLFVICCFLFNCTSPKEIKEELDAACALKPEAGYCKAAIPKFYYDVDYSFVVSTVYRIIRIYKILICRM